MHNFDSDIRSRLSAARLPAMPQVLLRLIAHCESDELDVSTLADLLANDVALTARVLRVAGSSAYRCSNYPLSLERAVSTIGVDMMRTLLITESVYQSFNQLLSDSVDLRGFWKHAMGTALAARHVAVKLGYPHAEEAYLAGLLHDVGRLALLAAAPEEYRVNFFGTDDPGLCAVEERTLRTTHAEVGAWLVEQFSLDSFLADAVLYHHEPLARLDTAHPLVRCVAVADLIAGQANAQCDLAGLGGPAGIASGDLEAIRTALHSEVAKVADCLGIDLSGVDDIEPPPASRSGSSGQADAGEQLGRRVRDLMLVSQAADSFSWHTAEEECMLSIANAAKMVFDLAGAIMMSVDGRRKSLVAHAPGEGRQSIAGFSIPLEGDSQFANAARSGKIVYVSASPQTSIGEEQLLRFFNAERLVAVPIGRAGECVGVLVGAVSAAQASLLQERASMLRDFGTQAGAALKKRASAAADSAEAMSEEFQLATRRMVHEVNNPLSIIRNYLAVLNRKLSDRQGVEGELGILGEEIDRIDKLVNEFAGPRKSTAVQYTEVNAAVRQVARLFRESESLGAAIDLVCVESPREASAAIDRHSLQQILINLVKNADEAMPAGGEIVIRNNGEVRRDGALFVEIGVKDNGPGMPSRVLDGLFSSSRTTKGSADRGLGLNIVHGLVTKAGGRIACHSDSSGTRFDILLPAADNATARAPGQPRQNKDGSA